MYTKSLNDTDLSDLLGDEPAAGIHEAELADLLGVTANRVRTLTRDGVIKRLAPARYDRRQAVRAYCEHLREVAGRKGLTRADTDALKAEKLRFQKEAADKLELANAQSRRELIPAAEVRAEWLSVAIDLRSGLMSIPSRVAARLSLDRSATAALEAEIKVALESLSDE